MDFILVTNAEYTIVYEGYVLWVRVDDIDIIADNVVQHSLHGKVTADTNFELENFK